MIQVWKIDTNDFFTGESYFVNENAEDYIESALEITTPYLVGYVKGKWDWVNKRWIEGATVEEIEEWQEQQQHNPNPLPSIEERITNIESYLVDQVEKQYMEVTNV